MLKASQKSLEILLTDLKLINKDVLSKLVKKCQQNNEHLATMLLKEDIISEKVYLQTLSNFLNIPAISLTDREITSDTVKILPYDIMVKYQILPLSSNLTTIQIVMANPLDIPAIDEVRLLTGKDVEMRIASPLQIEKEILRCYDLQDSVNKTLSVLAKENDQEFINLQKNNYDTGEAPIVKIVNSIFLDAIDKCASDIHFEPKENSLNIKYRIDGLLRTISNFSKEYQDILVSRLKVMAKMDITNKRIPQDGRGNFTYNDVWVDLRISTLPTIYGEKVVVRLLPRDQIILAMDQLGFERECLIKYQQLVASVSGMILVTGPTGCGKTTTLYSTLNWINQLDQNIVTIEDPVEYKLREVNQVEINEKTGLTFASGLRSILRQDPDIIMVGEIRDVETAQMAIRSALTGHLVFSTLHTTDCQGALSRLVDMGIPWYLLNSAVKVVLSQRLVRLLCNNCKQIYLPSMYELDLISTYTNIGNSEIKLYKPIGCKICHESGYLRRRAVFELLIPDEKFIEKLVNKRTKRGAKSDMEYFSLEKSAFDLVINGETSLEEVAKIVTNSSNRK